MTWVKIDDQFADHPKFVDLSNDAVALWVRALAYCNRHMTDGRIGAGAARKCANHARADKVIAELVSAKLWEQLEDGAFLFHDYLKWNESKETRERKADEAKARKERWKNARRNDAGTDTERVPERVPDASRTGVEQPPEAYAYAEAYKRDLPDPSSPLSPPENPGPAAAATGGDENPALRGILDALRVAPKLGFLANPDFAARIAAHCRDHGFTGRHALASVIRCVGEASAKVADLEAAGEVLPRGRIASLVIGCVKAGPKPETRLAPGLQPVSDRWAPKELTVEAAKKLPAAAPDDPRRF